jgi:dimethylamine monooxygenase subunit A
MTPALARLPGVVPMGPDDWVLRDAAYAPQMAERARLIAQRCDSVHGLLPQARGAAEELYELITPRLPGLGFTNTDGVWICPDGRKVPDDRANPLITLGLLVQPDLCLLQPGPGGEHELTGAILCFPASWTLSEKLGRPLLRIHRPVEAYDGTMARRVQRLFDAIRPEVPLMRGNALAYDDPALFQPRREGAPRLHPTGAPRFIRAERQCLIRLPRTGAMVFSIQTYVVDRAVLTEAEAVAFAQWRNETGAGVIHSGR